MVITKYYTYLSMTNGQRAGFLLQLSELKSHWSLHFFYKIVVEKNKK